MKARVELYRSDQTSRDEFDFGLGIQLLLDEEEKAIIEEYTVLIPEPLQFLKFSEHHQQRVARALRDQGAERLFGFEKEVLVVFKTIDGAATFEEAILKAFALLRGRIDEVRALAARLGVIREIEI